MKTILLLLVISAVNGRSLNGDEKFVDSSEECQNCCHLPNSLENGKMTLRIPQGVPVVRMDKTAPEFTTVIFKCRLRFRLEGKKISICNKGKWQPSFPICVSTTPESCRPPPIIENGEAITQLGLKNFPTGTRIIYQCDNGYEMSRGNELVCSNNGSDLVWTGETPECTAITQCNDPGVSPDGSRLGECCNDESVLQYECNPGFTLVGTKSLTCLKDVWSSPRPFCRPADYCPEPDGISHGKIIGSKSSDYYQTDDEISIECDVGYTISNGSDIFYCENGKWDDEFPICTEVECGPPKIPTNGSIHEANQSTFSYGFEVNFFCQEGFLLVGKSWAVCSEYGWNNPSPVCRKIRCPEHLAPEGGWKRGNSREVGDVVEFGCFSGYQLLGSTKRECLYNGKWNGELTRCDSHENDCPDPGFPINGIKIGRFYKFGNVVEFKCHSGKQLIGSQKRICQDDGEWSGSEAFCLDENDFDQKESVSSRLQEIINVEKTEQESNLNKFRELKEKIFSADSNDFLSRVIDLNHPDRLVFYFVFDMSGSIGKENFRKSINFVKLLINKIGVSEDGSRVGVMTFSDKANINFFPMIYTTTEDVNDALDKIEFTKGGGTATRLALRRLQQEMIPLTEERLKGKQKPIVFLLTDGKANMEGDPMKDAENLKKYGVEIYCIGITGDRNMKTLYGIASSKDEHVFILDAYDTMDWLVQEIINGTVDYSVNCGIQKRVMSDKKVSKYDRARVLGGQKALRPWPWMAALYFVDHDQDISKAQHRCGGSVIGKVWVLTAAHCFYDRENKLIPKENIVINLGLLNVKQRSNLQQILLEEYIIHPEYVRKTHHNDIALVKLSREAEFNTFVRPICLPNTDSMLPGETKFYREGERAVAIGWGYNKFVNKDEKAGDPIDHLKRVNLPLQNDITCRNSLNNTYEFTDSMFCAGNGKGKEDTCKGDSGGPLMQPMINDLGQQYWTQVGIVSWGVGCGQRGNYGFYTHVAKLKDWIDTTINNKTAL